MTTVLSALSPDSRTSLPSQSLKATGAWMFPKISRTTAAARAGVGLVRSLAIIDGLSPALF